uniref:Uncharacterized protein n=1 Tax=Alexandrium monilatum TaxID=311494 RepID=A0A7S4UZ59_9DINO
MVQTSRDCVWEWHEVKHRRRGRRGCGRAVAEAPLAPVPVSTGAPERRISLRSPPEKPPAAVAKEVPEGVVATPEDGGRSVVERDGWVLVVDRTFVSAVPRDVLEPQKLTHSQSAPGDLEGCLRGRHLPQGLVEGCPQRHQVLALARLEPGAALQLPRRATADVAALGAGDDTATEDQERENCQEPAGEVEADHQEASAVEDPPVAEASPPEGVTPEAPGLAEVPCPAEAPEEPEERPDPGEQAVGSHTIATQTDPVEATSTGPSAGKLLRRARRKARLRRAQEANVGQEDPCHAEAIASDAQPCASSRSVAVAAAEAGELGLLCRSCVEGGGVDKETMRQLLCVIRQRSGKSSPSSRGHGTAAHPGERPEPPVNPAGEGPSAAAPPAASPAAAAAARGTAKGRAGLRITELTLSRYALPTSESPFALHPHSAGGAAEHRSAIAREPQEKATSSRLPPEQMKAPRAPAFEAEAFAEGGTCGSGSASSRCGSSGTPGVGGVPGPGAASIQSAAAEKARTLLRAQMHGMTEGTREDRREEGEHPPATGGRSTSSRPAGLQSVVSERAMTLLKGEMHRMIAETEVPSFAVSSRHALSKPLLSCVAGLAAAPAAPAAAAAAAAGAGAGAAGAAAAAAARPAEASAAAEQACTTPSSTMLLCDDDNAAMSLLSTRQWQAKSKPLTLMSKARSKAAAAKDATAAAAAPAVQESAKGSRLPKEAVGGGTAAAARVGQPPALGPTGRHVRELLLARMRSAAVDDGGAAPQTTPRARLEAAGASPACPTPVLVSKQGGLRIFELPLGRGTASKPAGKSCLAPDVQP